MSMFPRTPTRTFAGKGQLREEIIYRKCLAQADREIPRRETFLKRHDDIDAIASGH